MKKILAAALFLILIIGAEVPYLIFRIQQEKIRKEIKIQIHRNLPEDQLVLFRVNSTEISSLRWIKKDKEFRKDGDLYDVVKSEQDGHFTNYYCIKDEKEEKLISDFERNAAGRRSRLLISKITSQNFLLQWIEIPTPLRTSSVLYHFFKIVTLPDKNDLIKPPPKPMIFS
jgi:hypothetical protein